jgi:AraC-like DNA-binding protein
VYGSSVYAFTKEQKMRAAAALLRSQADVTILEVAGRFGYDNGSKFAKAFRDVIGMTPAEYRNAGSIH